MKLLLELLLPDSVQEQCLGRLMGQGECPAKSQAEFAPFLGSPGKQQLQGTPAGEGKTAEMQHVIY